MINCPVCDREHNWHPALQTCVQCGCQLPIIHDFNKIKNVTNNLPQLPVGTLVKFDNKEHVWHGSFAIIRQIKHLHYRIEMNGAMIWVPSHWVKEL